MANNILKSLALAAGVGAALGFSAGMGRQRKSVAHAETTSSEPSDSDLLLENQAKEIAALRAEVDESGRKASAEFAAFERRLANTRAELPAAVEAAVTKQVDELRTRLQDEIRETTANGLTRIDQAIDEKLATRITALEATLADQSAVIGALNRRAIDTDTNLQKLISSVERLCDSAGAWPAPRPNAEPSFLDLPFRAEYEGAMKREPDTPPRMFASIK